MGKIVFELDNFTTRPSIMKQLRSLKEEHSSLKVSLFTLLSSCDFEILEGIAKEEWIELYPKGWDHFCETKWGYWRAAHFLLLVEDSGLFKRVFKMPWYRRPSKGFMKALKEFGYGIATPYRLQGFILKCFGIPIYSLRPDREESILEYPHSLKNCRLEKEYDFAFVSEMMKSSTGGIPNHLKHHRLR